MLKKDESSSKESVATGRTDVIRMRQEARVSKLFQDSPSRGDPERDKCSNQYGRRSFIRGKRNQPTMLYTFPGSGTTLTQLLVEYATGTYTGSSFDEDRALKRLLPGTRYCDFTVSMAKMHPNDTNFTRIITGDLPGKCLKGGIEYFDKAILVIRNPYDAIWSEHQRRLTKSHTGSLEEYSFDWGAWFYNANELSGSYQAMVDYDYSMAESTFGSDGILYIRYEDLLDKGKRLQQLEKMTRFLGYSPSSEQLKCAFIQAENPMTHRQTDTAGMTKDKAYIVPLVCHMWKTFHVGATHYGYSIWKNTSCLNVQNITIPPRPTAVPLVPTKFSKDPKKSFSRSHATKQIVRDRFAPKRRDPRINRFSNEVELDRCNSLYGDRKFINDDRHLPSLLYAFPGSGVVLLQLLIDAATGIVTGSAYEEDKITRLTLPGSNLCNNGNSAIKLNPLINNYTQVLSGDLPDRCVKSGVIFFDKAVILVRNPYTAIWSEHQRRVTRSQLSKMRFSIFDQNDWILDADELSKAFDEIRNRDYDMIEAQYGSENVMYIRYEDLIDKNNRISELKKLVLFLGYDISEERLKCAFIEAENTEFIRIVESVTILNPLDWIQREPNRKSNNLEVYGELRVDSIYSNPLVCHMWQIFNVSASRHGYSIWGNITCDGEDKLVIPQKSTRRQRYAGTTLSLPRMQQVPPERRVDLSLKKSSKHFSEEDMPSEFMRREYIQ